ncbi:hydroxymethylglutaryl-CoA reductase, degradative [Pediococcus argentinicus]|uniref:3-hydroxy-3-methylglutaryl coenzyme A reductase n=1 Tax=Pediococcus argentinicus TaxID=480391 RepID=A0A0R2NKC1_9LACO|nr:hydroxymethylglutaryl-CoA reductase, degradative [Pediococcus argentinicus]KRO26199.1 hydroxymethylglutaryl-CoA reductase, degradative [Pediococcus argentinicus]NKZ21596.1 hydroxymethylglutaryl-CoA reductase, degradative [Pediococcus argentinicus]GEP18821.1 3-hydroxy-3-methylglutaryl coenzyme A reductase [Pediococcus argentinicus]
MVDGYHKMSRSAQLEWLRDHTQLTTDELDQFGVDYIHQQMIENYLTDFSLPEGIAVNFKVNQKEYAVPMVTEEPSVIAAASNGAKIVNLAGGFQSESQLLKMGQVLVSEIVDPEQLTAELNQVADQILEIANNAHPSIVKRGGGARSIRVRNLGHQCLSIDVFVDTQEAMGANIINTMMESVGNWIQEQFSGRLEVDLKILSNLADCALTTVKCDIPIQLINSDLERARDLAKRIAKASYFAQIDSYRAATHNKGILNGIDAVAIATGNDWRAIQSGAHAFAAQSGMYKGLSTWKVVDDKLCGVLKIPLPVASVGGSITINKQVQQNFKILKVNTAKELAEVIGSVGLAQNLAALKALAGEGIQQGHMKLQAKSLLIANGAMPEEVDSMLSLLFNQPKMNAQAAQKVIEEVRNKRNDGNKN